ncbi:MAG: alpha/beta fold hydrolase [Anaerolinea sp.]|nr:alpha/beta fold hydrolase [Anaerolinea sp.]
MPGAPQDRTIQIGEIKTRYWAGGSQGSPVVLIHGLGCHVEDWQANFDALAALHRVWALDLPGHGRTDKPADAPYGVPYLATFVQDFMAALQISRAHVVGHSMGGAVATRLAFTHPELVDRLVLVASAGLGRQVHLGLRLASVPRLGERLMRPSRAGAATFARMTIYDPAVITEEKIDCDYALAAQPGALEALLRTARTGLNLFGQKRSLWGLHVSRLPSITAPVLVVWGRQDPTIPVAHAEVAAKGLPNVRVQIFDKCGHVPMLEKADAFNALLLEFLGDPVGGEVRQQEDRSYA